MKNQEKHKEIPLELLEILVCPVTKSPLTYDIKNNELVSEKAGLAFPVVDGIPVMLIDKARKIS